MKLSKKAQTFLIIGIFVVLILALFMAYLQQDKEQSHLSQELAAARLLLAKQAAKLPPEEFSSQKQELESRLAQVESHLDTIKAGLRQSIESDEIAHTLLEVAETSGVEITEIHSGGVTGDDLSGARFSVLSLTARIEGEVSNQIEFMFQLSKKLPTSVSDSIQINVDGQSATCTLRIYAYEDQHG